MKSSLNKLLMFTLGTIFGVSLLITYAGSYNSNDISYDNSTSHASATNVKEAIDFLYSHGSCGEGMSCFESPDVTINVSGPGEVSEINIKVPVYGRKQVTVTPDSGYVLRSFSCNNGYTLTDFKTLTILAADPQNIEIINSGILTGATCEVHFGLNELVEVDLGWSTTLLSNNRYGNGGDRLNSEQDGAICWYVKNKSGIVFNYKGHTGCAISSSTCKYNNSSFPSYYGKTFDCSGLNWTDGSAYGGGVWFRSQIMSEGSAICSASLSCET